MKLYVNVFKLLSPSPSRRMPSPLLCHHESSSTWRRSSRSMSSKAWRNTSSIRWSMKRSLSAPDLPFPLSRSVAVKRQEVEKQTLYQTHCRVIPWCQYYVLGRVSAGGKRVITIKHQPTQTLNTCCHTHCSDTDCLFV